MKIHEVITHTLVLFFGVFLPIALIMYAAYLVFVAKQIATGAAVFLCTPLSLGVTMLIANFLGHDDSA